MLLVLLTILFTGSLSAETDPSLTEWTLIDKHDMKVPFPMSDYILEIKSFLPDDINTNPLYGSKFYVDKSTSMITELFEGSEYAGRLTWNTIKYEIGFDVLIWECDHEYQRYPSWPCNKEHEQIWSWDLEPAQATLSCHDEVQYVQKWDEGDRSDGSSFRLDRQGNPVPFPDRHESCLNLGARTGIDTLRFLNMQGDYYRGRERAAGNPTPSVTPPDKGNQDFVTLPDADSTSTEPYFAPTDPQPEQTTAAPVETTSTEPYYADPEEYPTCDCWTRECGYCSDMACAVKYELKEDVIGNVGNIIFIPTIITIPVRSDVNRRAYNTIVLYDGAGQAIGNFQWNQRRIFLTGCVACRAPAAVTDVPKGALEWVFELREDAVILRIGNNVVFERGLVGTCAEAYAATKYFAFSGSSCDGRFEINSGMTLGDKMDKTCGGACPLSD